MGIFNFFKKRQKDQNDMKLSVAGNKKGIEWVKDTNYIPLAYNQYENFYWYKGDADYLGWFYTKGIYDLGLQVIMTQQSRINYEDYFWRGAYNESGIKRTHSGLPRLIVDTLVNCLGTYQAKDIKDDEMQESTTKRLLKILEENNFLTTFKKQLTMDLVIGDGAYIINVDPSESDMPLIEYIDGRDVSYEWIGDRVKAVIINKNYVKDNQLYECYERRSTKRIVEKDEAGNETFKTVATIEYKLFTKSGNKAWSEVELTAIPETENLKNLEYRNIPYMLAVPCIRKMDAETKRGESIFKGKIQIFDDLDQSMSQESNTMRAITPVEYIDSNLLDHDDKGNTIMPSAYGKQFITFKGSNSYSDEPKGVMTKFYDVDFNKLNTETQENIKRSCVGIIAPSTIGYDISKKDNAEAQREKEKATLQTLKDLQNYEIKVLTPLFTKVLAVDDLISNPDGIPQETNIQVMFSDYATPSRSERIEKFKDAYLRGAMSIDRYIQEVYFDEDKETQEKEKKALLEAQNQSKFNFNISEE